VITNASLVGGVIIGAVFVLAGIVLVKRGSARGGGMVTLGAAIYLGAQMYGMAVLRPFIGRAFDDSWSQQISTVEGFSTLGMLICAAGIVAHALALRQKPQQL
jgi:hypothetical protein